MKKHILLFTSLALSTIAMAQTKPSVGIRAGLSSYTLKGDAVNSFLNHARIVDAGPAAPISAGRERPSEGTY